MQWVVMAILSLCFDSSGTCFFKMMHMDALAMCCVMEPTDKHALRVWRMVNIFRTLFEDLPQCVLQILFVIHVKKNYVMIVSVLIGVATSCLAVLAAMKRAAEAAGTNWERLQSLATMNKALASDNFKGFATAAAAAEADNILDADELHAQWVKAEDAFDLPCGRKYIPIGGAPLEPTDEVRQALERSVAEGGSGKYSDSLRSVEFAQEAAAKRGDFLRELETPGCAAIKRGVHHEARHTKGIYDSQRRTVEFAIQAQEEREKRIQAMLVDAPGFCIGSTSPPPG